MSRKEWLAFILAVAFVAAPLAGGVVNSHRQPEAEQQLAQGGGYDYQAWQAASGAAQAFAAFVTVGIIAFQAVIFRRQTAISREQAAIADRQLRLTEQLERPLILVRRIHWREQGWLKQDSKARFPAITVTLANYGRGVALVDTCKIALAIGVRPPERSKMERRFRMAVMTDETGRKRPLMYANHYMAGQAMPPHPEVWDMPVDAVDLTPEQMDEIGTGHQKVWIDATAYYSDVGGAKRETHFRYLYQREADFFAPDESAPEFNRHT